MTDQEFATFFARMQNTFPELAQFFSGLEPLARQAMVKRYKACLHSTPLEVANDVLDDFSTEAESRWGGYGDRERVAAIIAKECSRRQHADIDRRQNQILSWQGRRRSKSTTTAQGTFGRILQAIDMDERHDEACMEHRRLYDRCRRDCPVPRVVAREVLASEEEPSTDEPPICKHCPGDGIASSLYPECFTPEFLAGGPLQRVRTYATACHCSEGVKRQNQMLAGNRSVVAMRPLDFKIDVWIANQTEHQIRVMARALVESMGGRREVIFDAMNRNGGVA